MRFYKVLCLAFLASSAVSCGAYFNQPIQVQHARIGESSPVTKELKQLPLPAEEIVVGVYNFRDLTGQYKPSEVGSTFSTAVTQGGTSILIKALEDSRWFTPIERENIGNLLNERNIIRSTRQEYRSSSKPNEPQLPPLLYAGIILEGGIVSYDTNIITGGMGARYFGIGGSTEYREDRVTVYLRAISTSSGKILKNVYVSKTILSQAIDANLFRYVSFQRLLEAEMGFTRNEPVQLAVTEAIEKAVQGLIIEGVKDNLWAVKGGNEVAGKMVADYEEEKQAAALTQLYDRKYLKNNSAGSIGVTLGGALLSGDYSNEKLGGLFQLDYTKNFTPAIGAKVSASLMELTTDNAFSSKFIGVDLDAQFKLLPNDKLNPYAFAGPGVVFGLDTSDKPENISSTHFKLQYGLGLEYNLSEKFGLHLFAKHNITLDDELDYLVNGKRDDHYFTFGLGVDFKLGSNN